MQFDVFHSLARVDSVHPRISCRQVFENFFEQAELAESLGFDTLWLAESHFSSEVQKCHAQPVIPNFIGEVGLNADSMQLINVLCERTSRLNFGTAIHNIVGGNGGPIASADRIRSLNYLNSFRKSPRHFYIGVATGRFPYINEPFGIIPRDAEEQTHWEEYKRYIFLEALEIFLRLSLGETLSSTQTREWTMAPSQRPYKKRWQFAPLKLVPENSPEQTPYLHFVLGSHDPLARDLAFEWADVQVFNLSFTPPEQIEQVHAELVAKCARTPGRLPWHRNRLPRTVLVFIDQEESRARQRAEQCFDTYAEAMRGTVKLPPKEVLMARALIGTPAMIREQLAPGARHGFHPDDRLMLWFEFNQNDGAAIKQQMRLFSEKVMPEFL